MSEEIENPRKYVCIHERRLNKNENRITELEAKASFKEERIHELKISMDEMDKKLDKIDDCVHHLKLQSERDDFNIDNRVTQLETTQNTLKWVIGIGLTAIGTATAVLAFVVTIVH